MNDTAIPSVSLARSPARRSCKTRSARTLEPHFPGAVGVIFFGVVRAWTLPGEIPFVNSASNRESANMHSESLPSDAVQLTQTGHVSVCFRSILSCASTDLICGRHRPAYRRSAGSIRPDGADRILGLADRLWPDHKLRRAEYFEQRAAVRAGPARTGDCRKGLSPCPQNGR